MHETNRYSIISEIGIGYDLAIKQYLLSRFETIVSNLTPNESIRSPQMKVGEIRDFVFAVARAAPIYLIEQFAPNAASYSSLRGAGYSEMSLVLAKKSLFSRGGIDAVRLNHEFRASANALDAAVDESDIVSSREDIRNSPIAKGFRRSKTIFFSSLKRSAQEVVKQNGDLTPFGNTARRYQMHQDLFLDLAKMKRDGISDTKYLKDVPQPPKDFLLTREQTAHLIVLGIDGETLLIDTTFSVNSALSLDAEVRDAAFWGAVMGALGDQWADLLQDLCSSEDNMFITVLDSFPDKKEVVIRKLQPLINKGRSLLEKPTTSNKLRFFRLQLQAHRVLRTVIPDVVEKYGQLIAKAFHEIPLSYRNALIPIRFGSWDLVFLYQLADFLLHRDKYEDEARMYSQQLRK